MDITVVSLASKYTLMCIVHKYLLKVQNKCQLSEINAILGNIVYLLIYSLHRYMSSIS